MTAENAMFSEEKEFIERLQQGDQEVWKRLWLEEAWKIMVLARRHGLDEENALDICIEVFSWVFRSLLYFPSSFRLEDGELHSYLHKIARRKMINVMYNQKMKVLPSEADLADEGFLIDMIASPAPNPEEQVPPKEKEQKKEERVRALNKAIEELAPKDRRFIDLLLDGYTSSEIANRLGLLEKTVRVRRHRILEKLRIKFAEALGES